MKKFTEEEEFDEVREEEDAMENIKNDDNDVEENIKKAVKKSIWPENLSSAEPSDIMEELDSVKKAESQV